MKKTDSHSDDQEDSTTFEIDGSEDAVAAALASLEAKGLSSPDKDKGADHKPKLTPPGAKPASPQLDQISALLQKKDDLVKEAHDRLVRMSADFDNFKKRAKKDQDEIGSRSNERFILGLLPIVDSFERTIEHAAQIQNPGEASGILEGVRLIHRQTAAYLEQMGVKPIEALHKPFDPKVHEAIAQEPTQSIPHMHVTKVVERGYLFHDRLLRPAKVIVAQNPSQNPPDEGEITPQDEITRIKC